MSVMTRVADKAGALGSIVSAMGNLHVSHLLDKQFWTAPTEEAPQRAKLKQPEALVPPLLQHLGTASQEVRSGPRKPRALILAPTRELAAQIAEALEAKGKLSKPLPLTDVLTNSVAIMQGRISRSRMAGEPADVLVAPRLGQMGLLDYQRGVEALTAGRKATEHMLPLLHSLLE